MIRESELWPQLWKRWIVLRRGRGGGEYYWEFLVGVCRPVLQIHTRFQTWRHYLD